MYAVEGGASVNGHQYYAPEANPAGIELAFGDTIPVLNCSPDFLLWRHEPRRVAYWTDEKYKATNFLMDTSVVRPAIEALTAGTDSLLGAVYTDLRDMAVDTYGHARLDYGYRYWFWNLTATQVLGQLLERGVIERLGNGQVRLSEMGQ